MSDFPEHIYHYQGAHIVCRDKTCEEDVVRSIMQDPPEYAIPADKKNEVFQSPKTRVYVDVGAYIGVFGIWALLRDGEGKVVYVEPIPDNIKQIEKNIGLNNLGSRTKIIPAAVGLKSETKRIISLPDLETESGRIHQFIGNGFGQNPSRFVSADTITLQGIFSSILPTEHIYYLKIDCEGGEYPLLQEGGDLLKKVGWVVGEFHQGPEGVRDPLVAAGFKECPYDKSFYPNIGLFRYYNPALISL